MIQMFFMNAISKNASSLITALIGGRNPGFDAFVIPIAFNEFWRNRTYLQKTAEELQVFNPFVHEGYLQWAPYSRLGFEAVGDGHRRYVRLKNNMGSNEKADIRYVSRNQIEKPHAMAPFAKEWGSNLYIAIRGEFESQAEAAKYFVESLVSSFMFSGGCNLDFGLSRVGEEIVASSLDGRLWLSAFGHDGVEEGICEHCGLPFFTRGKTGKRFCSTACLQAFFFRPKNRPMGKSWANK
ncbi:hypothetical protein [Slackia isoflavoniconvertens]|uniref:hypothetical protein n=1 Tax=Slackia isoflavoniconvertens TaxID=572010 RepID=UPI003A92DBF6